MRKKKRRQSQYLKAASLLAVTGVTTLLGEQVVQADEQGTADTGAIAESTAAGLIQTDSVEVVSAETVAAASLTEVAVETPELTYSDSAAASSASGSLASTETAASKEAETSAVAAEAAEAPAAVAETADSSAAAPETASDASAAETASRTAGITYRVAYRDAQTDELVHRVNQSAAVETTEERASTAITATADLSAKALAGYQLAAGESAVKTQTIYERQSNSIDFRVEKTGETVTEAGLTTAGSSFRNSGTPTLTIETYEGGTGYAQKGQSINLNYKVGWSNIDSDDIELTADTKLLNLSFDPVGRYITGSLTLDNTWENRTYTIGIQSKSNPSQKAVKNLTLGEFRYDGFILSEILDAKKFPIETTLRGGGTFDEKPVSVSDLGTELNGVRMPVTPFGYYVVGAKTVADVTSSTIQYHNDIAIYTQDGRQEFIRPLSIRRLTQTGGSDQVKVELYTAYEMTKLSEENGSLTVSHHKDTTPYYLRFIELPETAGAYFVTFDIEDNLGLVKHYTVNFSTYESSRGTGEEEIWEERDYNRDGIIQDNERYLTYSGTYSPLTNADIKYTNNPDYTFNAADGSDTVQVPSSSEEQVLATVILNKKNATVAVTNLPEGLEFDQASSTVRKKEGVILAPGIYTAQLRAVDGHFGDNAPSRTFTFEVTDIVNPIGHQTWQQGQAIPDIPVSLKSGSKIVSIEVRQPDTNYARLQGDSDAEKITGDAHTPTSDHQKATVVVGYKNNKDGISYTQADFTFEVQPAAVPISLDVTNPIQTVTEGDAIAPMVITKSDDAQLVLDSAGLPRGLSYDVQTQTISGRALDEGEHRLTIRAEKDGKFVEQTVILTVNPGPFVVDNIETELGVNQTLPADFGLDIPAGATVTWSGRVPGVSVTDNSGKITGVPSSIGTYNLTATITRTTKAGTKQSVTATATIRVLRPTIDVTASLEEQTVDLLTPITEVEIAHDGGQGSSWNRLPSTSELGGLTLTQRGGKYYLSGRLNKIGILTLTFAAAYDTTRGGASDRQTVTIRVNDVPRSLTVSNKNQQVQVLSEITPIQLTVSEGTIISFDSSQLPEGIRYDASSKTFSGTPTWVGTYTIAVTARTAGADNSVPYVSDYIRIDVTDLPVAVSVSEESQTVAVGSEITPIVVSHNPEAELSLRTAFGDLTEDKIILYLQDEYGLTYDAATNTVSGLTKEKRDIRLRFVAKNPLEYGELTEMATTVIRGVEENADLSLTNDRQLVVLGRELRPIRLVYPENVTVTVDEASLPAGVTYDAAARTISGTPQTAGSFDVTVTGEKGGKVLSRTAVIDVVDLGKTSIEIDPVDGTWIINGVDTNQSSRGNSGNTVTTAAADPVPTEGRDGDSHINSLTGDIFVKEDGVWVNKGNLKGAKGDTGATGAQGEKGDRGDTGATGAQGEKGEQGAAGQNGQDGKDGESISIARTETDASGNTVIYFSNGQSVTVAKGDKGDTGATGAQGEKGEQGAAGQNGQDGKDGESISIARTETDASGNTIIYFSNGQSVTVAKGDKGDTGATGAQGEKGEQGVAGQNGQDGKDGESISIARTETDASGNTVIYFSNGQSVTVAKGDKGDTGATGAQGEKGEQGTAGQNGQDGKDGESISIARTETDASGNTVIYFSNGQSVTVAKGNKGETGATGAQGEKGEQGAAGQNGQDGKDGESISIARTETDASGNTVIYFSNGQSVTVAKGDKGDTGATGAQGEKGEQGAAGQNGQDGKDGESLTIARTDTDASGNTIIYFSNGQSVTVAKGDKGDTGATGAQGEKGEQGAAGQNGQDGKDGESISIARTETDASGNTVIYFSNGQSVTVAKGEKGDTGATGAQGEKGEQGAAGQNGQDGKDGESLTIARTDTDASGNTVIYFSNGQSVTVAKGDKGDTGAIGAQGEKGDKGDTGAQGPAGQDGQDGKSISSSPTNPDVAAGQDGDTHINSTTGDVFQKTNGNWELIGNLKGPKGEKGDKGDTGAQGPAGQDGKDGQDGKSIYSGNGAPSAVIGRDGDSYVDAVSGDVFLKSDGAWNRIGNIKGAKGDTGAQGEQGPAGQDGTDGTSVLSGTTAPTPQEGKNGDIYINAKTGEISRKENDVWVIVSGTDALIDDSGNSNTGTADNTNTSGNTDAGSGSGSADPGTGSGASSDTGSGSAGSGSGGTGTSDSGSGSSSTDTNVSGGGSGSSSLTTGLDFPAGGQGASAVARASVSDLPFVDSQAFVRQANATLTNGNAGYTAARSAAADPQNAAALPSTGENSLSFAPLAGFTALLFGGTILRKRREDTDD